MTRAERRELNRRKSDSRLMRKITWSGFEGCKTPADMRARHPRLCRFFTESHNCSCWLCRVHSRRFNGNSIKGLAHAERRQLAAMEDA